MTKKLRTRTESVRVKRPNINRVSALAVLALDTRIETVMRIWELAHRFQSWDLPTYMDHPPSKTNIWKTRRIVEDLS